MPDVDEFLMHFGVKGMKWGNASRNAEAVLLRNAELAKDAVAKGTTSAVSTVQKAVGGLKEPKLDPTSNEAVLNNKMRKKGWKVTTRPNGDRVYSKGGRVLVKTAPAITDPGSGNALASYKG